MDFACSMTDRVVQADIISQNGRSKGCGIIEYESAQDGQRAIQQLSEKTLDGRPVYLREDREKPGFSKFQ